MAVFSERYLDYVLGATFISLVLLSLIFNPLSFIYHLNRDKKLSSRLYTTLAASDLLVTVVYPIFMSYNLLKSEPDEDMKPKVMKVWYYGLHSSVSWFTQILINYIVVVRCCKIVNPFRPVSKKMVISGITLTTLLVSTGQIVKTCGEIIYSPNAYWLPAMQLSYTSESMVKIWHRVMTLFPMIFIYLCGGLASVVMAIVLYRGSSPAQSRGTNLAAARIILCLTTANWIVPAVILYIICTTDFAKKRNSIVGAFNPFNLLCIQGTKVLVSSMDPILVFILSSDMREYVKGLFKRGALQRPVVHPATTTDLSVMSPSSAAVRDIDD